MITIAISYKKGTSDILSVNLASLARHTKDVLHKIVVLVVKGDIDNELLELKTYYNFKIYEVELSELAVTRVHGAMIDNFVSSGIETDYFMTLDSDCFPIADGWLSGLLSMGKDISGILHPWSPPPEMNKNRIEWRVRNQHCWNNTHVACQLIKTSFLSELGVKYIEGDDTGLGILVAANKRGLSIGGYKVTRCPKPLVGEIDPEFNRYVCLVFEDKVYHHGGWTRTNVFSDKAVFAKEYNWVSERIKKERGAEWLLDSSLSYMFKFDKEEEVAKEKMNRLFGMNQGVDIENRLDTKFIKSSR